jgi:hypothetical protein
MNGRLGGSTNSTFKSTAALLTVMQRRVHVEARTFNKCNLMTKLTSGEQRIIETLHGVQIDVRQIMEILYRSSLFTSVNSTTRKLAEAKF